MPRQRGKLLTMKHLGVLALVLLTGGCRKNEDGSRRTSAALVSPCSYSVAQFYSGSVIAGRVSHQTVAVQSNVTIRNDRLNVFLCRNADCALAVPSTPCAALSLSQQVTEPCFTTVPSVMISEGAQVVSFTNAGASICSNPSCEPFDPVTHLPNPSRTPDDVPPYSTYAIVEQICG